MAKGKPDTFYRKAKKGGFAARSVFKLAELDEKYALLRKGDRVLDLGASPGSWMQYASSRVGPEGRILGVDLVPPRELPENCTFLEADLRTIDPAEIRGRLKNVHVVLSDMAPKTTGEGFGDHLRSAELADRALEIAAATLKRDGRFLCKMFQGEESERFLGRLRKRFRLAKTQKPKASRSESREIYFVGLGFTSEGD